MNLKRDIACFVLLLFSVVAISQRGYQKDSVQIKVYTNMVVDKQLKVDTISVKKVFCDYCTLSQTEAVSEQSKVMTYDMRMIPKYRKEGTHRIAIYIRIPRDKFEELNDKNN